MLRGPRWLASYRHGFARLHPVIGGFPWPHVKNKSKRSVFRSTSLKSGSLRQSFWSTRVVIRHRVVVLTTVWPLRRRTPPDTPHPDKISDVPRRAAPLSVLSLG